MKIVTTLGAAALAAAMLVPAGANAAAPGVAEAAPALSLIHKATDRRDRDGDRRGGYDRDDDRRGGYDRDRGDRDRGDRYDRGDRGRGWGHGWRNRCRFVRRECAYRFDWGTWRFRRCVVRRGCW